MPILEDVLSPLFRVIDKVIPDPQAKAAAQLKLLELQQSGDLAVIEGQVKVNVIEAASPNVFVSGWRPAAGWVCVVGLGVSYVLGPLLEWTAALCGHPIAFPRIEIASLFGLLASMLGLSGMRSFDKTQGTTPK